jgi:hypothetical protein
MRRWLGDNPRPSFFERAMKWLSWQPSHHSIGVDKYQT